MQTSYTEGVTRRFLFGAAILSATSLTGCAGETETVTVPTGPPDMRAVREFTRYPLYWVGERFEGWDLTAVSVDRKKVTFVYGNCVLEVPADGGCAPTLQIQIWPRCVTLEDAESGQEIRGAPLNYSYGGDAILNTERVEIRVFIGQGATRGMKMRALRALRSANDVPPVVDAGDPLPRPRANGRARCPN
jgi:hypothetical protein